MKLGIVVSEFYWEEITSKMLELSLKVCKENNVETEVIKVPGSFDIPLSVKRLLGKNEIDGVITLGAVIAGETEHDVIISTALAKTLQELSLQFDKPVVLGVNGPRMSYSQAIARIKRAGEVTQVCINLVKSLKQILK
ncbi:MAG: 6,7-dimethyl-8-ribityllumazine synthase [Candidatus Woesearchaeota archaeon]